MTESEMKPPQDALEESLKDLLVEIEKEAVSPRMRELALRLDAALAAARKHRKN